jgi:hypothetical protein
LVNYEQTLSLIKSQGDSTVYARFIRPLIWGVLKDEKEWHNARELYAKYPDELAASLGEYNKKS